MPVFSWWFVEVSPIARIFSSTQMIFFCHVGGKLVVNLKHQGSLLFLEAVWRCFSFSWNIEIREKVIGRQGLLSLVDFSSFLQLLLFNQKLWSIWLFFLFYICGCKFFYKLRPLKEDSPRATHISNFPVSGISSNNSTTQVDFRWIQNVGLMFFITNFSRLCFQGKN